MAELSFDEIALLPNVKEHYVALRQIDDGRIIGVHRLLMHWTVHIDISDTGYEDRYCFQNQVDAVIAMETWTGAGDLPGRWHRHVGTNRRRDPKTGREWIER